MLVCLQACADRSVQAQARRLGSDRFTPAAWEAADPPGRGRMLASFLDQHAVEGMKAGELEALLGAPTAYADYDEDPAYLVGPAGLRGHLPVFGTDRRTGRVVSVQLVPPVDAPP
jgi:hypothetical protein